jgi:integrase
MAADNLECHQGFYRVSIRVPKDCQRAIGKQWLRQPLGTGSRTEARVLGLPHIARFKDEIARARGKPLVWVRPQRVKFTYTAERGGFGGRLLLADHPDAQPHAQPRPSSPTKISFMALIKDWAEIQKPTKESLANTIMIFGKLAALDGHDDATQPDLADTITDFKLELARTKSVETARKYFAMIKPVFTWAKDNRKLTVPNPTAGLKFAIKSEGTNSRQDGFSMEEMARIVAAAHIHPKPVIKILVLIAATSGACFGEICDADKRDFEIKGDTTIFHIRLDNRSEDQGLKTEFRPRRFPLHSSIVADVRAYLDTIEDGPLFSDIKINRFGKRAKNCGDHLRKFIKGLGIKRKGIGFHAFRHTAKTAYRRAYPEGSEIRDYLTGHASGSVAADYGKYPIATLRVIVESLPANPLEWELE